MRINSGTPLSSQLEIERTQKKPASGAKDGCAASVTAEFSEDVVRLSSLETKANASPEVRQEKVNALREAVNSGTYEVSSEALASAILRDVLKR